MLIYKVTNTINLKVYIGKTIQTLAARKAGHFKYNGKTEFNRALKKSPVNFIWEIIEDNIDSIDILDEREKYWILYYKSNLLGYNLTEGGDGGDRSKFINYSSRKYNISEEAREKKRQRMLNNNPNQLLEVREKISKGKKGKKRSISHNIALQKANKGRWLGEKNPRHVYVSEEVRQYILSNLHKTQKLLSKETGLSPYMVSKIIKEYWS